MHSRTSWVGQLIHWAARCTINIQKKSLTLVREPHSAAAPCALVCMKVHISRYVGVPLKIKGSATPLLKGIRKVCNFCMWSECKLRTYAFSLVLGNCMCYTVNNVHLFNEQLSNAGFPMVTHPCAISFSRSTLEATQERNWETGTGHCHPT